MRAAHAIIARSPGMKGHALTKPNSPSKNAYMLRDSVGNDFENIVINEEKEEQDVRLSTQIRSSGTSFQKYQN